MIRSSSRSPQPGSIWLDAMPYIGARNPDAARRFRLAAEATFAALACSPGIGAPYEVANPRLQGLRSAQVRRFRNYLIFYLPVAGGIDVIRVLHAARNIRAILEDEQS
jgi:toxin ParE1/3/4